MLWICGLALKCGRKPAKLCVAAQLNTIPVFPCSHLVQTCFSKWSKTGLYRRGSHLLPHALHFSHSPQKQQLLKTDFFFFSKWQGSNLFFLVGLTGRELTRTHMQVCSQRKAGRNNRLGQILNGSVTQAKTSNPLIFA